MPNLIDQNGITINTPEETRTLIVDGSPEGPGLRQIYGADINVEPNSPDGEAVGIVVQVAQDLLDLDVQNYNNFDPDRAIGRALDRLCAINGVTRLPGTYTQQLVNVTVDRALSLIGEDTNAALAFTVSDLAGNQYRLKVGYAFGAAGTTSLLFEAVLLGSVTSAVNAITNIVTQIVGVTGVNNPSPASMVGQNEESDAALRIRRTRLVALPGTGYLTALYAALFAVVGINQAVVYENDTDTTDGLGIPSHSIWVIASGGTDADIAFAIYRKRSAGCGMKGATTYPITTPDGSIFTVKFDRPTAENLWISFNVVAITGTVDASYIRNQLLAQLSYNINQQADTTTIVSLIKAISPNASVSDEGVSNDNVTYVPLLANAAVNNQWALDTTRIIINGSPGP